jgi:ribosomal protein L35
MRSHNLEKKSSKRRRALDRVTPVHGRDGKSIRKLLGL